MAGIIYTPVTLWEGFAPELPIREEKTAEYEREGIVYSKIRFEGRQTAEGKVKIFALTAYDKRNAKMPGVLIFPSYGKKPDEKIAAYFASRGYFAMMVDYCGRQDGCEDFTEYPADVTYANFKEDRDGIHRVETDARRTCWYEWSAVAQYAAYYLKHHEKVSRYGAFGIKHGATILWQLAALDPDIKCFASTFSAGWRAYRGFYKFSDNSEPELNDELYKYLAAIEPQSYAQYVKCPVLLVAGSNNRFFDADRAFDTMARVNAETYVAISPQRGKILDHDCEKDVDLFFDKFLKGGALELPEEPEIGCELINGSIFVKVGADKRGIEDVSLFAAEETVNPSLRCWNFKAEIVKETEEHFLFKYTPYKYSGQAMFFARVRYANGFTVCSRIMAKKFKPEEIFNENKSNVLFSSRENKYMLSPLSFSENVIFDVQAEKTDDIRLENGAFEIEGVTAASGIVSYKINNAVDRPKAESILLADVYAPQGGKLTVKLVENLDTPRETVYAVSAELGGGEVWHKVSFPAMKFKTAEGMNLKSMDKINMIVFECGGKYLLNNILWV